MAKEFTVYINHLPDAAIPKSLYLVHNHVKPVRQLGLNGFRAWLMDDARKPVECKCSFGGLPNAKNQQALSCSTS
jgi:hypothetical protein